MKRIMQGLNLNCSKEKIKMREFVYFSSQARTSGNFNDLMKAGRLDIALHIIISSLFLSNKTRQDTKLHLIFYGQPDPPKHIELFPGKKEKDKEEVEISKKDLAGLLKRILFKYKEGKKNEVFNGMWVEKKSFLKTIEELQEQGKTIYILDKKGRDIRNIDISNESVFVLGDQDGLPAKEFKRLKKVCVSVSVGKETYFASQIVTIVNNELDRRGV
jgi:tRNA (pseudouridine54-N1)-methyltransferase